MPQIAENVAERLVIKAHTSGTYDPTAEPDVTSDPGSSGGQIIRYVDHNLSLTRDAYSPNEMREDQQQPIDKLGTKRVPATINALLSCASHKLLMEAVLRGTWSAAVVADGHAEFTSVAADNASSKFTYGGGDPVSEGYRVGDVKQFGNLSEAANNGVNFTILAFGGSNNREVTVYPAPTDMTADNNFTVTTVGRSLIVPSSAPVRRKFVAETHNSDSDLAKLYTEIAFHGMNFGVAPNQDARISFTGMGRNRIVYTGGDAPFFGSPTAAPSTDVISSMDGLILLNGSTIGYLTGLDFSFAAQAAAPAQIKSDGLAAGVVPQGNRVLNGNFTAFELDATLHTLYDNHTEFAILAYLPASNGAAAHAITMFLPRVKITNQQVVTIDGAKALQCSFSGGRYLGSGAGIESTMLRITDTQVS